MRSELFVLLCNLLVVAVHLLVVFARSCGRVCRAQAVARHDVRIVYRRRGSCGRVGFVCRQRVPASNEDVPSRAAARDALAGNAARWGAVVPSHPV
jgi:hypothetical protein